MRDGAVIDLGNPVREAEKLAIDKLDRLMKCARLSEWDTPDEGVCDAWGQLKEAHAKLRYARFWASGGKLEEGRLTL